MAARTGGEVVSLDGLGRESKLAHEVEVKKGEGTKLGYRLQVAQTTRGHYFVHH